METRPAPRQKALDEAAWPRRLDELELEVAEIEIAPIELVHVPRPLLHAHAEGEVATEVLQRRIDRRDGDRHVIDVEIAHRAERKLISSASLRGGRGMPHP